MEDGHLLTCRGYQRRKMRSKQRYAFRSRPNIVDLLMQSRSTKSSRFSRVVDFLSLACTQSVGRQPQLSAHPSDASSMILKEVDIAPACCQVRVLLDTCSSLGGDYSLLHHCHGEIDFFLGYRQWRCESDNPIGVERPVHDYAAGQRFSDEPACR
jgi:hypothetical protein